MTETISAAPKTAWRSRRGRLSTVAFCLLLAIMLTGLRFGIYDRPTFFTGMALPNHDILQGIPFFTTSAHSVRLSGDIAWWNPVSYTGYAQYYQAFLGPLAPTYHHISFIVWMQAIRVLTAFGVVIPEYTQYLIVNYLILPTLATFAVAWFAAHIVRTRLAVTFVLILFTFSSIGTWNNAWFYHQEWFSLFFWLAAGLAFVRRPRRARLLVFAAALLIQAISLNYWTVYNLFFIAAVVGGYAAFQRSQVRRALARLPVLFRQSGVLAGAVAALLLVTLALWGAIGVSIAGEQTDRNVRHTYTLEGVQWRIQEMRRFTTELFNPIAQRPIDNYRIINATHNARYLGAFLIPLLILIPLRRWRRNDYWWVTVTGLMLVVCLAPPFLLQVWEVLPGLDRILHLFYFYTHFWQIGLAILAGLSLDAVLRQHHSPGERRRFGMGIGACAAFGAAVLAFTFINAEAYPPNDPALQSIVWAALLVLIAAGLIGQSIHAWPRSLRRWGVVALVVIALTDLTRYFVGVQTLDLQVTQENLRLPLLQPLPDAIAAPLAQSWRDPEPALGFAAGLAANLPIRFQFWPDNTFMRPLAIESVNDTPALRDRLFDGTALVWYPPEAATSDRAVLDAFRAQPDRVETTLWLDAPNGLPTVPTDDAPSSGAFAFTWDSWGYNDFALQVTAPDGGWLYVRQVYDPLWDVRLNGETVTPLPANEAGMAFPVAAGDHDLTLSYRPLARALYGWAIAALEVTLVVLAIGGFVFARRDRRPPSA